MRASLISVGVNTAVSHASPTAEASITDSVGGGEVETDSSDEDGHGILISTIGTGWARAGFIPATFTADGVKIAVNVVIAEINGEQTAALSGVTVTSTDGGVTVESIFNKEIDDVAAEALQGVGGENGTSLSIAGLSIEANTAIANANFTSKAISENAEFVNVQGYLKVS